ncbi:hypothetical protein SAY87_016609 [Trapa incisa]|uniref:COX VIIa-like protein n=1 Tax=Trapa incisa TaxID=236973 RepID=A0AAN7LCR7_9MYRT|nr:hypothetical protein SAY87_016609 [Trapa incisa]
MPKATYTFIWAELTYWTRQVRGPSRMTRTLSLLWPIPSLSLPTPGGLRFRLQPTPSPFVDRKSLLTSGKAPLFAPPCLSSTILARMTETPFRPREKLIERQKYFQNIHKHTYLKGPFDKITSVAIPLALATTATFMIARGIYNMSHGIGKKE